MSSSTTTRPRHYRGANGHVVSAHHDENLLDLIAEVARAAAADPGEPRVATPDELSVPVFNRLKVPVDRAAASPTP